MHSLEQCELEKRSLKIIPRLDFLMGRLVWKHRLHCCSDIDFLEHLVSVVLAFVH
jgi:hypothetical protein